jgi:hypothetical protein
MTSHPELEDNILPSSSQSPTIHPLYSSCVLLATTAAMGKKSMLLDASLPVTRELSLPEINALIPRRVQMSSEQPKMLLFSLLVFLATGAIWFGFYSYYSGHVQQREVLRRDGRELIAQITDLPSGKGQTYVQYTFRVGRVWYSGEAKLPDGPLEVAVGQPIPIRYLPADPTTNHPAAWEWRLGWDIVPILFLLLLSGAGFLPGVLLPIKLLRERTLARNGWCVDGKVTGCAPNHTKFSIDYEFHTQEHLLVEGSNGFSDEEYELGARIRIIYLRDHPRRNAFYPLLAYQIVEL